MDYEDTRNNPYKAAPVLNIPVFTQIRLEATNITFEEDGNGTALLTFQIINKGLAPLSNLNVRIEGPMIAGEGDLFIGTLAPGAFDFYDDQIFPFEFGELNGEIVLEYEDASGTPGELRIPISAFISEPFFPDMEWSDDGRLPFPPGEDMWYPEDFEEPPTAMPWWQLALIVGGGLLVIVGITLGIIRRINRKRREAEDFDY
jgi:hypothetical protein